MRKDDLFNAMRDIDTQYIMSAAPGVRRAYGGRKGIIVSLAAAACLVLILSAVIIPRFIPKEYDIDNYLKNYGMNEASYGRKNVWIYYAEDGEIKREYVKLEDSRTEYLFSTWQAVNGLEEGHYNGFEKKDGGACIFYVEGIPNDEVLIESLRKTFLNDLDGIYEDVSVVFGMPRITYDRDKVIYYDPATGETRIEEITLDPDRDPESPGETSPPYIPNK